MKLSASVRAVGIIGPQQIEVVATNEREEQRTLARVEIPDEDLAKVVQPLLLRCYHQRLLYPELWDVCHVIASEPRPKKAGTLADQAAL